MTLIAKLEVATEGSRELDVAICEAVGECGIEEGARCCPNLCSSFSTSTDAARSLMTPDWEWELRWEGGKAVFAIGDPARGIEAEAPTEPLAICLGYFQALAMGEG